MVIDIKTKFKIPSGSDPIGISKKLQSVMRYATSLIIRSATTEFMKMPGEHPEHRLLWIKSTNLRKMITPMKINVGNMKISGGATSNANYSYINEYGGMNEYGRMIPSRPFMRPALFKNQEKILKRFKEVFKK